MRGHGFFNLHFGMCVEGGVDQDLLSSILRLVRFARVLWEAGGPGSVKEHFEIVRCGVVGGPGFGNQNFGVCVCVCVCV